VPSVFFDTRQEPLDLVPNKTQKYMSTLESLKPLQPGDAHWLLHIFLKEQFPNGGEVDTGNPIHFPGTVSVWDKLSAFCIGLKYSKHPHAKQLHAVAVSAAFGGDEKKYATTTFKAVLEFLRGPFTTATKNGRYSTPGQTGTQTARKEVFTIKGRIPPGIEQASEIIPDLVEEEDLVFENEEAEASDPSSASAGAATGAKRGREEEESGAGSESKKSKASITGEAEAEVIGEAIDIG